MKTPYQSLCRSASRSGAITRIAVAGRIVAVIAFTLFNERGLAQTTTLNLDSKFKPFVASHGGQINALAVQPDDKIVIVGTFAWIDGVMRRGIARLNADGALDLGFDPGTGAEGPNSLVDAVVLQSNGQIVIGGEFTSFNGITRRGLARLNTDGRLDRTFTADINRVFSLNTVGLAHFNTDVIGPAVYALATQTDGKMLAGGDFNRIGSAMRNGMARLNSDGTVDSAFGPNLSDHGRVTSIVIQPDARVLVAGDLNAVQGVPQRLLVRLNADGTVDSDFKPAFDMGGNFFGPFSRAPLALGPDGKIVIAGPFTKVNGIARTGVARLNPDGTLDETFNPVFNQGFVQAVAVQSDGKTVVTGYFGVVNGVSINGVVRLNADGSIDHSFKAAPEAVGASTLAVQSDGKLLMGSGRLVRLNLDGSLDTNFQSTEMGSQGLIASLVADDEGKIVIGGWFHSVNRSPQSFLARLRRDGSLDSTFKVGEVQPGAPLFFSFPQEEYPIGAIVRQSDGKFLVAGSLMNVGGLSRNGIVRLNADGSVDPSFDPGVGPQSDFGAVVTRLALQHDDKIVVAGRFNRFSGAARVNLARLNADGSIDDDFSPTLSMQSSIVALLVLPGDKIIIAGYFDKVSGVTRRGIAQLNSNGTVDLAFDPGSGVNEGIFAAARQDDGKILIGGQFRTVNGRTRNGIARLQADGSVDTAFNVGSGLSGGQFGYGLSVRTIALQPDGKIVIGGHFGSASGFTRSGIARLNPDGSVDESFDPGSGIDGQGTEFGPAVHAVLVGADGSLVIGGDFAFVNGEARFALARFSSGEPPIIPPKQMTYQLDPEFNVAVTRRPINLRAAAVQLDDKIVISGDFGLVDGVARRHLARLNPDGSLDLTFAPPAEVDLLENPFNVQVLSSQEDGKLFVAGANYTPNGGAGRNIIRLQRDGTLDVTFEAGIPRDTSIIATAIQPDGKAILGPVYTVIGNQPRTVLARLNPDGSVDATFTPSIESTTGSAVETIVLQADNKIFIGGGFIRVNGISRRGLARLNPDGKIDNGFNPGAGIVSTGGDAILNSPVVQAIKVQPDGAILLGGRFGNYNGIVRTDLARIKGDGTLDESFAPQLEVPPAPFDAYPIETIALQPDGRVLIGGWFSAINGVKRSHIARLKSDGSVDESFNPGAGADNVVSNVFLRNDGKILLHGFFRSINNVSRDGLALLNVDGTLATSFHPTHETPGGVVTAASAPNRRIALSGTFESVNGTMQEGIAFVNDDSSMDASFRLSVTTTNLFPVSIDTFAWQTDGKLVVVGNFQSINGQPRSGAARFHADGALDASFHPQLELESVASQVAIQPDGKLLIAGRFTRVNGSSRDRLARFNPDGTLDSEFKPGFGKSDPFSTFAVLSDAKIILAGAFGNPQKIAMRLNSNGTVDASFKPPTSLGGFSWSVHEQLDGKVLLMGDFFATGQFGIGKRFSLVRLQRDGTWDQAFEPRLNEGARVQTVATLDDGKILIGGSFTTVDGLPRRNLARLMPDGAIDNTFDLIESIDGFVSAAAILENGDLLVAGDFTMLNGEAHIGLARFRFQDPNARPRFGPVQFNPEGSLVLTMIGTFGRTYRLEASSDLVNWILLSSVTLTAGSYQFSDTDASRSGQRFYRVSIRRRTGILRWPDSNRGQIFLARQRGRIRRRSRSFLVGSPTGFTLRVQIRGRAINQSSVRIQLDGIDIPVTTKLSHGIEGQVVLEASFSQESFFVSRSQHEIRFTARDTTGATLTTLRRSPRGDS